MPRMKAIIRSLVQKMGYHLVPVRQHSESRHYPRIRRYEFGKVEFDFWIADEQAGYWYDHEGIEPSAEGRALLELVHKGDRVLEIGSHHGFYTMLLSQAVGDDGFVLGVEAEAKNTLVSQAQVTLNEVGSRCRVLNRAGADKSGSLQMATPDGTDLHACTGNRPSEISV